MNNMPNKADATRPSLADDDRQICEVWTRVMGYHRPTHRFNPGKKAEYAERVCFKERKPLEPAPKP